MIKSLVAHEAYIYTMTITPKGQLYSSSCDGSLRLFRDPLNSDESEIILKTENDEICALWAVDDSILYTVDDHGVVARFINNKIDVKYNLIEEVKSFAVEGNTVFTARNLNAVITELSTRSATGKYSTKTTIPQFLQSQGGHC